MALLETTQVATTGLPIAQHTWFDGRIRGISFGPYLVAYASFVLVLLFGSLLPGAIAHGRNPVLFLVHACKHTVPLSEQGMLTNLVLFITLSQDKICIHQQDTMLKKQGITAINEFIRRSSRMLVCHSTAVPGGSYFERLW